MAQFHCSQVAYCKCLQFLKISYYHFTVLHFGKWFMCTVKNVHYVVVACNSLCTSIGLVLLAWSSVIVIFTLLAHYNTNDEEKAVISTWHQVTIDDNLTNCFASVHPKSPVPHL